MIKAKNYSGEDCFAWLSEKENKPYYCPGCEKEVILKKGLKKISHFAHKPPVQCEWGNGESEIHHLIKQSIYEYLIVKSNCKNVQLERYLGEVRPDVYAEIDETPVAIEIQKSNIDILTIQKRMRYYLVKGIYVIWIIPKEAPESSYNHGNFVCSPKQWEKYLHALNYGKLFYWQNENKGIKCYHFDDHHLFVEATRWGGGYSKKSKRYKSFSTNDKILFLDKDFYGMRNEGFNLCKIPIEQGLIFNYPDKWWK